LVFTDDNGTNIPDFAKKSFSQGVEWGVDHDHGHTMLFVFGLMVVLYFKLPHNGKQLLDKKWEAINGSYMAKNSLPMVKTIS